jgi:hypothetical protein
VSPLDETLRSMHEIVQSDSAPDALRIVCDWILSFVNKPHPSLGRLGVVCPFVPSALNRNTLWLAVAPEECRSSEDICHLLHEYKKIYQSRVARIGHLRDFASLILAFPRLVDEDAGALIQDVHRRTKPSVVAAGMMLGEFYPESRSPGVHNPEFYPLRSPMPLFVFRQMVENDLVFLVSPLDSPERRRGFIEAYLSHMGARLSSDHRREALASLAALSKPTR